MPSGKSEPFTEPGLSEKPMNKEMDPKESQWFPKVPLPAQLMGIFAGEVLVVLALNNRSTAAISSGCHYPLELAGSGKASTSPSQMPCFGKPSQTSGNPGHLPSAGLCQEDSGRRSA